MYDKGFTLGLNQTEGDKTTQKVKIFKPRNTVELSSFISAIRPGAKSLVDDFISRRLHTYGIPALDKLLKLNGATGITGQSSYLFYDENVLQLGQAAGIEPADSYVLLKAIKKKKESVVSKFKEQFIKGFTKYLIEKENTKKELAEKTSQDVWQVIIDSANYLFNSAHAYAMCLDSLYGAMLKYEYPYEFYKTMLELYTEKGNKEKVSLIIDEMKRYKNINMVQCKFREDNRNWSFNKEERTITQNLASVKFMSQQVAEDLYNMRNEQFDSFVSVLRYLQINTCLDTRQIEILILLNYFKEFGSNKKLIEIFKQFFTGTNKVTKTIKSAEERMLILMGYEDSLQDESISIQKQLESENTYTGLCTSISRGTQTNMFFVMNVESKYGIKVKLYNISKGTSGEVRISKNTFANNPLKENDIILLGEGKYSTKHKIVNGEKISIEGIKEYWMSKYFVVDYEI